MFKILSFFIGLIFLFFLFYYGSSILKDMLSGGSNWFTDLNSGNQSLLKVGTDSNGMFQDNSNATVSPFLERFFPGIFPLFKINPNSGNAQGLNNQENFNLNTENTEGEYMKQIKNEVKYPDNQVRQIVRDVRFGKE